MRDQILPPTSPFRTSENDNMPAYAVEYDFSDDELPRRFIGVIDEIAGRDKTGRLVGVGPGTLVNLRKGRRKNVSLGQFAKIRAAVIRVIEHKIRALEAQRLLALQSGVRPDDRQLLGAASALAQLESLIKEASR